VTGVPADRAAELAAELGPSLAGLSQVQDEAAEIRSSAAREAARVRREAADRAEGIIEEARARAPQVRHEAAAAGRRAALVESAELLTAGEQAAESVRRRVAGRMPELVERVAAQAVPVPEEKGMSRWAPGGSAE
jgi:hypothetical protein